MPTRTFIRGAFLLLAWMLFGPGVCGLTHAQPGTLVPDREMPSLAGGSAHLLSARSSAEVIVYFRPGQDYSSLTLKEVAALEKELTGKPVHWIAVVSDRYDGAAALAMARQAGIAMPVVVDAGDHLYGELGAAQVPVVVLVDQNYRLVAYESFRKVNYAAVVRARIQYLLKEINDTQLAAALNPPVALTDSEEAAGSRRLLLAAKLLEAKSYEKALENVEVSLQRSPSAAAYALRGQILAAQGKCPEALTAFQQALRLDANNLHAVEGSKSCSAMRH